MRNRASIRKFTIKGLYAVGNDLYKNGYGSDASGIAAILERKALEPMMKQAMTVYEQGYDDGYYLRRVNVDWLLTLTNDQRVRYHEGSRAGYEARIRWIELARNDYNGAL